MEKTILFDVDGVFLSEERYFDASALTVWELLHSDNYLGVSGDTFEAAPLEPKIREVRTRVFSNDDVLNFIKSRGINSNWDMVFLAFSYQLIRLVEQLKKAKGDQVASILQNQINRNEIADLKSWLIEEKQNFVPDYASFVSDFSKGNAVKGEMLSYLNQIALEKCGVKTEMFSRNSELWVLCQQTFQEWYLGDGLIVDSIGRVSFQPGKKGFLSDEIAIVPPSKMRVILQGLKDRGYRLGIGTGRPSIETYVPLEELGLLEFFEPNRIVTASHVLDAENEFPEKAPLSKPHPYCYLHGYLTREQSVAEALSYTLTEEEKKHLLIVGDSLADLLAARSIGCQFAATLTGLSGEEAREKFVQEKAEFIWKDVSEVASLTW
ncbi:HAD family hydrolase [Brevibacillus daliensis]|uniref:HAD family hydrolase n=1 Tax=Brevibacillus daliensis TaxID=2892995 RepID=UPI001E605AF7|nr:HAD family hydrolase [Brevibacillus daliensis]